MNKGKICISVCASTGSEMLSRVREASSIADVVELRLDCLPSVEIDSLLTNLPQIDGEYLVTFRPRSQGGHSDATREERIAFWSKAVGKMGDHDSMVDYEGDIDPPPGVDASRRIVSMHDFENSVSDLRLELSSLARLEAGTVKIAVSARDITDSIEVWNLLQNSDRRHVIPIAMGEPGKWTRVLGLAHGSPMTYASLDAGDETAPGQFTARDLIEVFRVRELDPETSVFGVVAADSTYSLSPYMHNAAFRETGINAVFIPLQVGDLNAFVRRMVKRGTREVELNFKGFSVTNPHKQAIIEHLDELDETAAAIGAVNTVKIDGDKLIGFNTDAGGFIKPLEQEFGDLRNATASVIGAGGAARACIYSLKRAGAEVTLIARESNKATALAREFDISLDHLRNDRRPIKTDILVNATPLGTRGPGENKSIATADELRDVKLVYDLVYNPSETRLLREAKAAGARTIGGLDMLVAQGAQQFKIWTGQDAPMEIMRAAVRQRLK